MKLVCDCNHSNESSRDDKRSYYHWKDITVADNNSTKLLVNTISKERRLNLLEYPKERKNKFSINQKRTLRVQTSHI